METEAQAPQRIADGCTLHAGEPFTAICRGCGTYMCPRCSEGGPPDSCPACRAKATREVAPAPGAFPFRRDGIVWGRFLRYCFEIYTRNFGLLTLAMVVCFGSMLALQMVGAAIVGLTDAADSGLSWAALSLTYVAAISVLVVGVLQIALGVARNEPTSLALLWRGFPRLGAFLLVTTVMAAATFGLEILLAAVLSAGLGTLDAEEWTLGTLLVAILLGFAGLCATAYVSLGLVFACVEVVAQPGVSVWRALKNAWRIADGERLTLGFGLFLLWMLACAGLLLCGVGAIFTLGYAAVLFASLYLALRNGAPLDV